MTRQVHITLTDEVNKKLPAAAQRDDDALQAFINQFLLNQLQKPSADEEEAEEETKPTCRVYQMSEDLYAYEMSDEDFANLQAYADDTNHTPEEIFQFWVQGKIDYLEVSEDFLKEQKQQREQEKNRSLQKFPQPKKSKHARKKRSPRKEAKV